MDESPSYQPERELLRAQTRHMLEARIDRLPDMFRSVFILRAVEELSVEETSACLGIPAATVRSRYFRARGLLRNSLKQEAIHGLTAAFSFVDARSERILACVTARLERAHPPYYFLTFYLTYAQC